MGRRINSSWRTIELFLGPAMAPRLVHQRPWYVLSCPRDDAYKIVAHGAAAGFLSRYLCGLTPYNSKQNVLSASFPSLPHFLSVCILKVKQTSIRKNLTLIGSHTNLTPALLHLVTMSLNAFSSPLLVTSL